MSSSPSEPSCPICCESYTNSPPHTKITCTAPTGCRKFHMCRLCVHRQSSSFSAPFLVDEDTGDFCSIDPTSCPQCKRTGAFDNSSLPPLEEGVLRTEEEDAQLRRRTVQRGRNERLLRRLECGSRPIPLRRIVSLGGLMEVSSTTTYHECIRQLSGYDHHAVALSTGGVDTLQFAEHSTVGMPGLYTSAGVFYYEVCVVTPRPVATDFQCGFSLLDGMETSPDITHIGSRVGETRKSWGFDGHGNKLNGLVLSDQRYVPHWYPGCVMGFAVNVDKGMIATSTNGNWDIIEKCGVRFEDVSIQRGVYPCISARGISLQVRYRPDTWRYAPPPREIWECWPKYQELSWITLPSEARTAAMTMGYTSLTWAWSGNPIDTKGWEDLSREEQAAGAVLGYNQRVWTQLITLWAQDAQDNSDSDSEGDTSFSCFSAMFWDDLPQDARLAAETLGYSKTAWDEDSRVPLGTKWFSQLTKEQRKAAILLGYDSQSWNEYTESNLSPCEASDTSYVLPFDHLQWDVLPPNARHAAETIGYTKDVWDGGQSGPLDGEPWCELTLEEQEAATVLGYEQSTWDGNL